MPLYCVELNRTLQTTEYVTLNIWADNAEEASEYVWDNVNFVSLDWNTYEDLSLVDGSTTVEVDHQITSDPYEAREDYGTYNEDDIPEEDDDDDDSSFSRVSSQAIARYNMGEEIPA